MTVYVDDMRRRARVGRITANWSHLQADTHDELEEFARKLGLDPAWIQHPYGPLEHYDVTDSVREKALALGATPMQYGREGGRWTMAKAERMKAEGTWPLPTPDGAA